MADKGPKFSEAELTTLVDVNRDAFCRSQSSPPYSILQHEQMMNLKYTSEIASFTFTDSEVRN
jgi:hypothetical protein